VIVVIVNVTMVVAFSVNKEDTELAAFPLTDLARDHQGALKPDDPAGGRHS
jgi:hypothetical protein